MNTDVSWHALPSADVWPRVVTTWDIVAMTALNVNTIRIKALLKLLNRCLAHAKSLTDCAIAIGGAELALFAENKSFTKWLVVTNLVIDLGLSIKW